MAPSLPALSRACVSCNGTGAAFLNAFDRIERRKIISSLEFSSLLAGLSAERVDINEFLADSCIRGGVCGAGTSPEGNGDLLVCLSIACDDSKLLPATQVPSFLPSLMLEPLIFGLLAATWMPACAASTMKNSLVDGFMPTHSSATKRDDCGICRTRCVGVPDGTCLSPDGTCLSPTTSSPDLLSHLLSVLFESAISDRSHH
jgi:hypothetical protein